MNNQDSNKILIKIKDNADTGATETVLAGQTSASLEITKEMREFTSKTTVDGNGIPIRRYIPTRVTSSISIESLQDASGSLSSHELIEMCYDGVLVDFALGGSSTGDRIAKGSGYLSSASGSYAMDETVSGSFTLQIDGGLTFEDVV
ncbi:phage tail tube protein [Echinicola shivajiensis]|uniref:phage tail tube protein n=1 Tax=Echinicola shivajiensis TaxID=1035916 RepID=UPI001BFCA002|nr:phage tail tube protein [Echinicola shivajiensis]